MDPTTKIQGTDPKDMKVGTDKPQGIPTPKQDFEKILDDQKKSKQGQSGSQSFSSGSDEESTALPSPFDLPKARPSKGEMEKVGASVAQVIPKKTTATGSQKTFSLDEPDTTPEEPVVEDKPLTGKPLADKPLVLDKPIVAEKPVVRDIPVEVKEVPVQGKFTSKVGEKKEGSKLQFSKEMPDLSQVNPLGVQVAAAPIQGVAFTETPPIPRVDMDKLIAEIVDSIQTMTNAGQTETTVTLKGTPLLEGARIVITSFESAPKEYNVSFENLTPDAKRIMDMNNNQQSLMTGFKDNGMVLHIITTNTQIERPIYTGESTGGSFSRERGEGGSSGGSKEKRERE